MITESYIEKSGDRLLFRLQFGGGVVMDVLTDAATMIQCADMLSRPGPPGLQWTRLGSFGPFEVTLNLHADRTAASICIDGPDLDNAFSGNQAVVVSVGREEMIKALTDSPPW